MIIALSIYPDKIFFVLDKIFFVPDKIFFVLDKTSFVLDKNFCPRLKSSYLLGEMIENDFRLWNFFSIAKKLFSIHFTSKNVLFSLGQNFLSGTKMFCVGQKLFCPGQKTFCLGQKIITFHYHTYEIGF